MKQSSSKKFGHFNLQSTQMVKKRLAPFFFLSYRNDAGNLNFDK